MFTEKTVLILGAGASAPYGFPSGEGLVEAIKDGMKEKSGLFARVRDLHTQTWKEFADRLLFSGVTSVDIFLEKRENEKFLNVGKASIAAALLPKERRGKLFQKPPAEQNWYKQLFGLLTDGCSFEDLGKNNLSVVTFNYDRSLEYYLVTALCNLFGKTEQQCYECLRPLKMIHVHGRLGRLPWESPNGTLTSCSDESIPYGGHPPHKDEVEEATAQRSLLTAASRNIRIISEAVNQTDELKIAGFLLQDSSRVFILGFGFHPTNLGRLKLDLLSNKRLKCTVFGLPADRRRELDKYSGLTNPIDELHLYRSLSGWFDGKIGDFIHKVGLT